MPKYVPSSGMLVEYLKPLPSIFATEAEEYTYGANLILHTNTFPEWETSHIVIIGVPEGRYGKHNHETSLAPDAVRRELYKLASNQANLKITDLGNILSGMSFDDTAVALQEVVTECLQNDVLPIVIGGSKQLGFALYKALASIEDSIDCSIISPYINLEDGKLLNEICLYEPNHLFNLNVLAYQSHYAAPNHAHTMDKMFFTALRLGMLKSKMNDAEPILRNTDMLLYDIGSVKQADAPGNYYNNPSGLTAEEACQLSWYAGISDKIRIFGLFEINPEFDYRNTTSKLGAQLLWYFIDGYYSRKGDHPDLHNEFIKYRCALNDRQPDILFYKSKRTDRWWMDIPNLSDPQNKKHSVTIPCTYEDYKTATKGDMPDRFFNALQRMPK